MDNSVINSKEDDKKSNYFLIRPPKRQFKDNLRSRRVCEGVGLVNRVHTLLDGVHKFATNLKEVEEVRQEVREVKDEGKREINLEGEPHTS